MSERDALIHCINAIQKLHEAITYLTPVEEHLEDKFWAAVDEVGENWYMASQGLGDKQ